MKKIVLLFLLHFFFYFTLIAQESQDSVIQLNIACGFAGQTSPNIENIRSIVQQQKYILLKLKLSSNNRSDLLLSAIVLKELQLKHLVTLSPEELLQIDSIKKWPETYSLCYTCTGHYSGKASDLMAAPYSDQYNLIKSAIFKKN